MKRAWNPFIYGYLAWHKRKNVCKCKFVCECVCQRTQHIPWKMLTDRMTMGRTNEQAWHSSEIPMADGVTQVQNKEPLWNQYIEALTIFILLKENVHKLVQICFHCENVSNELWGEIFFIFCHFAFASTDLFIFFLFSFEMNRTHVSASATVTYSMKIYEVCLFHLTIVIEYFWCHKHTQRQRRPLCWLPTHQTIAQPTNRPSTELLPLSIIYGHIVATQAHWLAFMGGLLDTRLYFSILTVINMALFQLCDSRAWKWMSVCGRG